MNIHAHAFISHIHLTFAYINYSSGTFLARFILIFIGFGFHFGFGELPQPSMQLVRENDQLLAESNPVVCMRETDHQSIHTFLERSETYLTLMSEKDEIDRHKWIECEKAGHDIGFDRAMFEWIRHHK